MKLRSTWDSWNGGNGDIWQSVCYFSERVRLILWLTLLQCLSRIITNHYHGYCTLMRLFMFPTSSLTTFCSTRRIVCVLESISHNYFWELFPILPILLLFQEPITSQPLNGFCPYRLPPLHCLKHIPLTLLCSCFFQGTYWRLYCKMCARSASGPVFYDLCLLTRFQAPACVWVHMHLGCWVNIVHVTEKGVILRTRKRDVRRFVHLQNITKQIFLSDDIKTNLLSLFHWQIGSAQ